MLRSITSSLTSDGTSPDSYLSTERIRPESAAIVIRRFGSSFWASESKSFPAKMRVVFAAVATSAEFTETFDMGYGEAGVVG